MKKANTTIIAIMEIFSVLNKNKNVINTNGNIKVLGEFARNSANFSESV